jgi:general secretion pathway protein M
MKEWFQGLGSRERLILGAAAVVLALLIFYALIWSPMNNGYETMKTRVDVQRDTAVWMEQGALQLQQLQRSRGPAARGLGGQSLLALTDSTARSNGLGPALKRVEPEGSNNVRVWLEIASFDLVVKWLAFLSTTYGIDIDSVTLERISDTPGQVNARLTLQAPNT